ncbi:unnamed protein product, partial [Boreogadus saida]
LFFKRRKTEFQSWRRSHQGGWSQVTKCISGCSGESGTSPGEKDHTKSPTQHQQPSKWKEVPRGIISTTAQKLLNPKPETSVRRRSQTQTHVGLTSCPRTRSSRTKRYSNMMMLKTGSPFLILYGLCQIPLAQGQTPRKDETTETTQTWKSQETGAGTEGSQRGTQDNPAPTHSGLVNKKGKIVLYAQIPPQNQVNLFTFTVISGYPPLCTLTFRQNCEHADKKDRCEVHIQFYPLKWCLTVTSGKTWDYNRKYELNMREYIFLFIFYFLIRQNVQFYSRSRRPLCNQKSTG